MSPSTTVNTGGFQKVAKTTHIKRGYRYDRNLAILAPVQYLLHSTSYENIHYRTHIARFFNWDRYSYKLAVHKQDNSQKTTKFTSRADRLTASVAFRTVTILSKKVGTRFNKFRSKSEFALGLGFFIGALLLESW